MSREEVLKKVDIFLLELDPHHHVFDVFDMIECEYTESQLKEFAIDFADHQTKSLKEENKELRDYISESLKYNQIPLQLKLKAKKLLSK